MAMRDDEIEMPIDRYMRREIENVPDDIAAFRKWFKFFSKEIGDIAHRDQIFMITIAFLQLNKDDLIKIQNEDSEEHKALEKMLQFLLTEANPDSQQNNPNNVIIGDEIISEEGAALEVRKLTVAPGLLNTEATKIPGQEDFQEATDIFTLAYWKNLLQRFLKVK